MGCYGAEEDRAGLIAGYATSMVDQIAASAYARDEYVSSEIDASAERRSRSSRKRAAPCSRSETNSLARLGAAPKNNAPLVQREAQERSR